MVFLGEALFPTSRIEVFFSLKGVARHAVRLVLVSDRWESWLSQVADAETKQAMRQHPHLSKLFFLIFSRYFKDHGAKIRTIFLALSGFVGICRILSVFVGFFLNKYLYNSQKITNFAA
jgi:hypothetical protein